MTTALEKTKTEIEPTGFDRFISLALEKQVPVETLERLLAMQKEIMAANAKAAYDEAMKAFQKACPIIQKHKRVMNKDGHSVRYIYAPLDDIIEQVKGPLADNGFSYRLGQEVDKPKPGWLTVTCTATHVQGHSETEKFELPLGTAQFMTAQQEVGAARTFGARYCFLGVFGIMTGDEDTDANPPEEKKSPSEKLNDQLSRPPVPPPGNSADKIAPTPTPDGKLTVSGEIANCEDLPLPKKPGSFRYKITLAGQPKPFYTFDKKVRDLVHEKPNGMATIVYHVGKYGQDIDSLTFCAPGEVLDEYKGELEDKK